MNKWIAETVREGVFVFLLTLSLIGYIEVQDPWMPEHTSNVTIETEYWIQWYQYDWR